MAKGKTNSPLRIWVWHPWVGHAAVAALHDAGHRIAAIGSDGGLCCEVAGAEPQTTAPDLILHPAAHNWSEPMFQEHEKKDGMKHRPYLDAALTAARARKKRKLK